MEKRVQIVRRHMTRTFCILLGRYIGSRTNPAAVMRRACIAPLRDNDLCDETIVGFDEAAHADWGSYDDPQKIFFVARATTTRLSVYNNTKV
jgi:hypothetical protein